MNNKARETLCTIIRDYGRDVARDPKRCKGFLKDLCSEHTREINILVMAMEERVAVDLLDPIPNVPYSIVLPRLAKRLHDDTGITTEFAQWAVESWALALGVIQEHDLAGVKKEREKQEREREERERKAQEERERKEREERERKAQEERERWERDERERKAREERERKEKEKREERERKWNELKEKFQDWRKRTWKVWTFVIKWTLTMIVGVCIIYVVIPPLNNLLGDIVSYDFMDDTTDYETRIAGFCAMFGGSVGAIFGAFLGVIQYMMVLQKYTNQKHWWILSTAVGFAGSFSFLYLMGSPTGAAETLLSSWFPAVLSLHPYLLRFDEEPSFVLYGAVSGFIIGLSQWRMLKNVCDRSAWWIVATTLTFGVMVAVSFAAYGDLGRFVAYTIPLFALQGSLLEWLIRKKSH